MPHDWPVISTASLIKSGVLSIGDGYRAMNSEMASEGVPFARAADIDRGINLQDADRLGLGGVAKAGDKVSLPGDTVFTSKGTVGRFAYVGSATPQFVYSPQLCYWRSRSHDKIGPRFLHYWLRGPEAWDQFKYLKGQTDMADYVSLTDQRDMAITLPPISDQRRIAAVLASLDDKVDANRRLCATLTSFARTMFDEWFKQWEGLCVTSVGDLIRDGILAVGDGYRA